MVSEDGFSTLDFILVPTVFLKQVLFVQSDTSATLASHHFPVVAGLQVDICKHATGSSGRRLDWNLLREPSVQTKFVESLEDTLQSTENQSLEESWQMFRRSVQTVGAEMLPKREESANKPWIRSETLALLELRRQARSLGKWDAERDLRKQVKKSARRDRAAWLEQLVADGSWPAVRKLRRGRRVQQGRLRNASGELVCSEHRAETLAEHLETVQWAVRPVALLVDPQPAIDAPLPVNVGNFSESELCKAIGKMKSGKATKNDDIPVECFKALAKEGGRTFQWVLDFWNECWMQRKMPEE